jgi:hypothetical protein
VRYEADVVDGFDGTAVRQHGLYDQVAVRWHNRGTIRVSTAHPDGAAPRRRPG